MLINMLLLMLCMGEVGCVKLFDTLVMLGLFRMYVEFRKTIGLYYHSDQTCLCLPR